MQVGKKSIEDMLLRLVIPKFAKNEFLSIIFRWILEKIRSSLQALFKEYITQTAKDESEVTILIEFGLPVDFMKNLTNVNLSNLEPFISNLRSIRPSASMKSIAGYKL